MTNKNDPFEKFITQNTSENLPKPINEFSEILQTIDKQKKKSLIPRWLITSLVTASLVILVGTFVHKNYNSNQFSDEDIAFLFETYDQNIYGDDEDDTTTIADLGDLQLWLKGNCNARRALTLYVIIHLRSLKAALRSEAGTEVNYYI